MIFFGNSQVCLIRKESRCTHNARLITRVRLKFLCFPAGEHKRRGTEILTRVRSNWRRIKTKGLAILKQHDSEASLFLVIDLMRNCFSGDEVISIVLKMQHSSQAIADPTFFFLILAPSNPTDYLTLPRVRIKIPRIFRVRPSMVI